MEDGRRVEHVRVAYGPHERERTYDRWRVRVLPERVVLTLMPGQPIQVDGRTVPHEDIGPAITRLTGGDLDTQIVVMADARVPYEELVAALDEVRLAKYHRIALAAKAKTEEKPTR